ncbi:hypothetical protein KIH74_05455 [Kineosporia sp. J2-2]|uniref:CopG family transcriptional regulator n=1 Tax=Kineosporia corallincola TaxID=2835133 RepID=A0ABS5TD59_9ACTN|nr:hypothetical protein [Kineosporia corallincola]MBT0768359.1 hypothetical protein [Kineosporia corallincola]
MTDHLTDRRGDAADWSRLDMDELVFLGEEHLPAYGAHLLPPPGTSTSTLVLDVEPEVLDALAREAAASGRTLSEVAQDRLRRPAA